MPEGYRHLTFDGRCRIYATGKGGFRTGPSPGGRAAIRPPYRGRSDATAAGGDTGRDRRGGRPPGAGAGPLRSRGS